MNTDKNTLKQWIVASLGMQPGAARALASSSGQSRRAGGGAARKTSAKSCAVLVAFAAMVPVAGAKVALPPVIGNGMVLQQGKPLAIWGRADPGEKVAVIFGETNAETVADGEGRWRIALGPQKASLAPREMRIVGQNEIVLKDILVGEVWLCSGQSNMAMAVRWATGAADALAGANDPALRLFKSAGGKDACWRASGQESAADFSAVAYSFGRQVREKIKLPVGLIAAAAGGTPIEWWMAAEGCAQHPSLEPRAGSSGIFYQSMIAPLAPFGLRGVLWYQGEANCSAGDTHYTDKTKALIGGWRQVFGQQELSFYFVQIAPYAYTTTSKHELTPETLPKFWEAQRACLAEIPKSGMAVICDLVGNVKDIHPTRKKEVGERLSLWALHHDYGMSEIVPSGPLYKGIEIQGGKAVVAFDYVGKGLKSMNRQPLAPFLISGADGKFVPAEAQIAGGRVIVSSPEVARPVAVRYCWHETAIGNLANEAGLPAAPFFANAVKLENRR